jgi:hypothetical protein
VAGGNLKIVGGHAPRLAESFDVSDGEVWEEMVDRTAKAMAERMWGAASWYRGAASAALTAALNLDPVEVRRVEQDHADKREREMEEIDRRRALELGESY